MGARVPPSGGPAAFRYHQPAVARRKPGFFREHSLTLIAGTIFALWLVLYSRADPKTHTGAFFGNAIADWSGVLVIVLATKYFYERGSAESKPVPKRLARHVPRWLAAHSLTILLAVTGLGWLVAFARMDSNSKWGQVVGNVLSEWVQLIGVVLLTKSFLERGSAESRKK